MLNIVKALPSCGATALRHWHPTLGVRVPRVHGDVCFPVNALSSGVPPTAAHEVRDDTRMHFVLSVAVLFLRVVMWRVSERGSYHGGPPTPIEDPVGRGRNSGVYCCHLVCGLFRQYSCSLPQTRGWPCAPSVSEPTCVYTGTAQFHSALSSRAYFFSPFALYV